MCVYHVHNWCLCDDDDASVDSVVHAFSEWCGSISPPSANLRSKRTCNCLRSPCPRQHFLCSSVMPGPEPKPPSPARLPTPKCPVVPSAVRRSVSRIICDTPCVCVFFTAATVATSRSLFISKRCSSRSGLFASLHSNFEYQGYHNARDFFMKYTFIITFLTLAWCCALN